MSDSFIFYQSFYDAITELEPMDKLDAYEAICAYALTGEIKELKGVVAAIFKLVKPQIDANKKRRENGKNGGRPKKEKTETKPKQNQTKTKAKPNVNVNVNVNANENENDNGITTPPTPSSEVFDYQMSASRIQTPDMSELSDPVREKLQDWISYKKERKETYKPMGLKSLVTQTYNAEQEHGSSAVIKAFDLAMASGWKGPGLERITSKQPDKAKTAKDRLTEIIQEGA